MTTAAKSHVAPLLALCVAFSILVGMHTSVTPVFEAPDEVWHYAYVRWLAEGNGLPPLDRDSSGAYQEAAQPPLYYLVAALISRPFDDQDLDALMWHNPNFGYQAPGTASDNKNMLIHSEAEAFPWRNAALTIHVTRAASWIFGLVTVIAAWGLSSEVFRDPYLAITTGALVAFHPQFVFMSSVVSNDSAAAALATIGLWLSARMLQRGTTWKSVIVAGLCGGLAAITKTSLLPMLAVLAGCVVLGHRKTLHTERQPGRGRKLLVGQITGFVAIVLIMGGWWYLRNVIRYGDPLGLSRHTQTLWGRETPATLLQLVPELPLLWRSLWAAYGWGHVMWPDSFYVVIGILALPLLAMAVVFVARTWLQGLHTKGWLRHILTDPSETSPRLFAVSLAIAWSCGIFLALIQWMRQVEAPHGRLLFPAIGAWSLILTLGLRLVTHAGRHAQRIYRIALLGLLVTTSTLAPAARILSTFGHPRLYSPETLLSACPDPMNLVYDNTISLLCLEASPRRVAPGDTVHIKACWTSAKDLDNDYTVFIHLLGPDSRRFAERHTYPGLGRYPTSLWEPERAFCETYALQVEPWADTPVRTKIEIGFFAAEDGRRLPVTTTSGQEVPLSIAGSVDIATPPETQVETSEQLIAVFGTPTDPPIGLLGYEKPESAQPGSDIDILLNWEAIREPTEDYVAFIHIWQPGDPEPLAQSDAPPRGGWYPTSAWQTGDQIPDIHRIELPETLLPGTYPIWAGLYRASDGARLPAYDPVARYPNDLTPIGTITIH